MTVAQYWPVGSAPDEEETITFTPASMSGHLLADWVPSAGPAGHRRVALLPSQGRSSS